MNLKTKKSFSFPVATAIAAASVALLNTPVHAATIGPGTLSFSGNARLQLSGNSGILNFAEDINPYFGTNSGVADISISSTGAFENLGNSTATIYDLQLTKASSGQEWSLTTPVTTFLQIGSDLKFYLTNFKLVHENSAWSADYEGYFENELGETIIGFGQWSSQNRLVTGRGTTFSSDIAETKSIPTPALLPGLLALGAGVLRKRQANGEQEAEA